MCCLGNLLVSPVKEAIYSGKTGGLISLGIWRGIVGAHSGRWEPYCEECLLC